MDKQALRQIFLQKRKKADHVLRQKWSKQIEEYVLNFVQVNNFGCVMAYAAYHEEVETEGIIRKLLKNGVRVALPKCYEKGHMSACQIAAFEELSSGQFGILEPPEKRLIDPFEFDLVLVPGCAFGYDGSRLGYGGGFYDRYLPKCTHAKAVGLGYNLTMVDALPTEPFDVLMDAVITETGVVNKV